MSEDPFSNDQQDYIRGFIAGAIKARGGEAAGDVLSAEQQSWILEAIGGQPGVEEAEVAVAEDAGPKPRVVLMFGSQSGNSEELTQNFGKKLAAKGYEAPVVDMADFKSVDLTREENLIVVSSTWGEGEPPDNAVDFWEHLESDKAPQMPNLRYSVLSLGDTDYPDFCEMGRRFDQRFEELGAKRFADRMDCNVDFETNAEAWFTGVVGKLAEIAPAVQAKKTVAAPVEFKKEDGYSKAHPFPAPMLRNRRLTMEGSTKDTRHFEISLEGSGLSYEVGDALGVYPENDQEYIEELLQLMHLSGEEPVPGPNGDVELRKALLTQYTITTPSRKFVTEFADRARDFYLKNLLRKEMSRDYSRYIGGRELVDLFQDYPRVRFTAEEFVSFLSKLNPRLYSIASSLKAHPDEVHLTVGRVEYETHGRRRKGICSTWLSDRIQDRGEVPVYVHPAKHFKPPVDPNAPMIMVGPGTGIAPFRAFLEERQATGARGQNWLFFGNPHRRTDFCYEEELTGWHNDGLLTRLDVAFSRDQGQKVYVQHLMERKSLELWQWMEKGAHFYVCGDAVYMAKDVDAALHKLAEDHGGMTTEDAKAWVKQLKKDKRYQRDVY